ncbi:hypothetical protein F5884DRAFT_849062 [Xylogone sp. PMI_703]|nr:hypothetical protein F5884DRAFT_849062 [Xylogone sp. PMI_703]
MTTTAAPIQAHGPYYNVSSVAAGTVYVTVDDCPATSSSVSSFGSVTFSVYSSGLSTVSGLFSNMTTLTGYTTLTSTVTTLFTETETIYSSDVSTNQVSSTEAGASASESVSEPFVIQTLTETVVPLPSATCQTTELPTMTETSTVYVTIEYTVIQASTTQTATSPSLAATTLESLTTEMSTWTTRETIYTTKYYTITETLPINSVVGLSSGSLSTQTAPSLPQVTTEAPETTTVFILSGTSTTTVTETLAETGIHTTPYNTTTTPVPLNTTSTTTTSNNVPLSVDTATHFSSSPTSSAFIDLTTNAGKSCTLTASTTYGSYYTHGYNGTSSVYVTSQTSGSIGSVSYPLPTASTYLSVIGSNITSPAPSTTNIISSGPTTSSSSYAGYGQLTPPIISSPNTTSASPSTSTQSFDDAHLPSNIQNYNAKPAPIFNPYHRFGFTNGFVVVPPPTAPYLPSSGRQMAEFTPYSANATAAQQSITTGQIYNADGISGCYNFNAYGASFGCNSIDSACDIVFTGYQYSAVTRSKFTVAAQHISIPACAEPANCALNKVILDGSFKSLSSIQINATVAGSPVVWWMDDLKLGWYDNSCKAQLCRKN